MSEKPRAAIHIIVKAGDRPALRIYCENYGRWAAAQHGYVVSLLSFSEYKDEIGESYAGVVETAKFAVSGGAEALAVVIPANAKQQPIYDAIKPVLATNFEVGLGMLPYNPKNPDIDKGVYEWGN